jgi:two-component system alkaline phosphatase synthesis response regulator PhoP
MKASPINILLIESFETDNILLRQVLNENGYQTQSVNEIEHAIEKIMNHPIDLVISENKINEMNGFAVFKTLKKYLRNNGIPFFLVFDRFEKEDMLIGLEIGIDNFIVSPINKDTVCYKVESQLNKRNELDIFKLGDFLAYFHTSSVAMFYVDENKITLVNESFYRLHNGCAANILDLLVESVFNISQNKQNELNYRRFQNGIINHCKLDRLNCSNNTNHCFDISFYRCKNQGAKEAFAEMVPSFIPGTNNNVSGNETGQSQGKTNPSDAALYRLNVENIKLTKREHQIFEMSKNGQPIKLIAVELGLSERTVEKHRANIMAKANAKNMIEAIVNIQKGNGKNEFTEIDC